MATWGPIQLRLKGSKQVEFDGEASPAPGGGSTPYQTLTYTAAEIAARWDNGDSIAAMEVTSLNELIILWAAELLGTTLDQNGRLYTLMAYSPGAASADVYASGEDQGTAIPIGSAAPGENTYSFTSAITDPQAGLLELVGSLAGAAIYVLFTADAAPTTGQISVRVATAGASS